MKNAQLSIKDGRPGFAMIENAFIDGYGAWVGAHGIAAYCILARFANGKGEGGYPSYETVGRLMGASRRTAIRAIQRLVDVGLVNKDQRFANGEAQSNTYTLLPITKPQALRHGPSDSQSPPSDSQSPPSDSQSPPSDSQSPDQEPINKNQLTRTNEQHPVAAAALAFSVKANVDVCNSQCRDHAHDATRIAAHRFGKLAFPHGGFNAMAHYIDHLSADQLTTFCAWCYYTNILADTGDTTIKNFAAFIKGMTDDGDYPSFTPDEETQFTQRMAAYIADIQSDVWDEVPESEFP